MIGEMIPPAERRLTSWPVPRPARDAMWSVSSGTFGLYADVSNAARDLQWHALVRRQALRVLQRSQHF